MDVVILVFILQSSNNFNLQCISINPYIKVLGFMGSLSSCFTVKLLIIPWKICNFFSGGYTVKLLKNTWNICNFFRRGYLHLPKIYRPWKIPFIKKKYFSFLFHTKVEIGSSTKPFTNLESAPRGLEVRPANNIYKIFFILDIQS